MTKVFLIVSVACNVWFLSLLLYDRIMETKLIRFFRHIAGLWRSLDSTVAEQGKDKETPPTDRRTSSARAVSGWLQPGQRLPYRRRKLPLLEKGIELSEEEATFDDGNTKTASRPRQIPEDKLDETFMSISPSELEYGEDDPEDEEPDKKQASGSSFEDIDIAVRAIRKDSPSDEEMRHAGKVMTELDGTELFTRITERLTDEAMSERLAKAMSVFVDTVNMTVTRQKEKVFVIPDNIEEFDFRNYV